MTDSTPIQRIAAGYETLQDEQRTDRVAGAYRHDPQIEAWIKWRTADPARFERLPASALMSVGYYEQAKTAYEALLTPSERLAFRRRGGAPEPEPDAA